MGGTPTGKDDTVTIEEGDSGDKDGDADPDTLTVLLGVPVTV